MFQYSFTNIFFCGDIFTTVTFNVALDTLSYMKFPVRILLIKGININYYMKINTCKKCFNHCLRCHGDNIHV